MESDSKTNELSLLTADTIFKHPTSQYERFVNLYSNVHNTKPKQQRFRDAQQEWAAARKAGCIDTVYDAIEVEATRKIQLAKTTKSKFRGFFLMKRTPGGMSNVLLHDLTI